MLHIIDYGVGNLRSIERAFAHVGVNARISSNPDELSAASHLALPGVGAFGAAMDELRARRLDAIVLDAATAGTPILGICVGFQMLFDEGHEFGVHPGLGLLAGRIVKFPPSRLPVPHTGWNQVRQTRAHPLFRDIPDHEFFYFVHSYYVEGAGDAAVLGVTEYGFPYPSACVLDNVMGIQFHPEKSQTVGLRLLKNFAAM
jgi:glutamine amidotransferase